MDYEEKITKMADALIRAQRKVDALTSENRSLRAQIRANVQEPTYEFLPGVGDRNYRADGIYSAEDLQEEKARQQRERQEIERQSALQANLAKHGQTYTFEPAVGDRDFKYNEEKGAA